MLNSRGITHKATDIFIFVTCSFTILDNYLYVQEDENRSESAAPREVEYDDENEDMESDADDFIVDDDGRPIAERKKKRKPIFTDALVLQSITNYCKIMLDVLTRI